MRGLVLVALAAGAVLSIVVPVASTLRGDGDERELARALDALVEAGMPGALVRVRDGDEILELARGETRAGIRFRVGSVTKTFVAALTLMLADRDAVGLDDRVDTHLPGLLRDGDQVTIRDLLMHRAGLFDYTSDPALLRDDLPPGAIVRIADRRERTPGYAYSSTNYLVLGLVLEKATGTRIGELLRTHLFEPFALDDTTFEPGVVSGPHLHGYTLATRDGVATGSPRDTSERSAVSAWAAAAVVSTAGDLDRFFTQLRLRGYMARMAPVRGDRYGLGLGRGEATCGSGLGHTGNLLGTVTVVRMRGDRIAIVVGNAYPFTHEVGQRFADLLREAICG